MKWLSNPLVVGLCTVLVIIFLISLSRTDKKFLDSYQKVQYQSDEVSQLRDENNQLMKELEVANSEFSQEKIIRDQLLMHKPGEYVVQLTSDPRNQPIEVKSEAQITPLEAWKKLLFG